MSALVRALSERVRHLPASGTPGVLVTGVDGPVGTALAVDLAARGFTVHGTHQLAWVAPRDVPGMQWHLVPRPEDPGYLPALHRIVQHHAVDFIIPTTDEELPVIAGVRRWPDEGVFVVVSGPGPVSLAQDKLLTSWQLTSHGVLAPACASPSDFADTAEALASLGDAIVLRSRHAGRKSGGARVVHRPDELEWDRLDDDFVVQHFICGPEYLCCLYRPDGPGNRGMVVFEVLRPGPRHDAVRALSPGEAEDLERTAWAAVRALGVLGPAEVILRRSGDGRAHVISVHPRFSQHCGELLDQLSAPAASPSAGRRSQPTARRRRRPVSLQDSKAAAPSG